MAERSMLDCLENLESASSKVALDLMRVIAAQINVDLDNEIIQKLNTPDSKKSGGRLKDVRSWVATHRCEIAAELRVHLKGTNPNQRVRAGRALFDLFSEPLEQHCRRLLRSKGLRTHEGAQGPDSVSLYARVGLRLMTYLKREKLDISGNPADYLKRMAANLFTDLCRQKSAKTNAEVLDLDCSVDEESCPLEKQEGSELSRRSLRMLTEK